MTYFPRAFTLIETIVIVALSTVMMGAVSMLVYDFTTTTAYQQALTQSSGSASILMREVKLLVVPANAVLQSHDFSGAAYSSSSSTLVLEIPSVDSAGNAIANTHDYAVFYTDGADAYRILDANPASARTSSTKKLSSTIQSLSFSYDSIDFTLVSTVTADVQVRAVVNQSVLSGSQHEQIRLRNR